MQTYYKGHRALVFVCLSSKYVVAERSQMTVSLLCLQVVATDADGRDFGTVRYSVSDGFEKEDKHPLFSIHPEMGELCVSQDMDRDAGPAAHDILVKAEDQVTATVLTEIQTNV